MAVKQYFTRLVGVAAVASIVQASAVAPVAAQAGADDSCTCIVASGTVGKVTSSTGWVKINGATGLVDAAVDSPLSLGSVLRTGVAGSAGAMVGEACNVNVAALSQMSISALDEDRMCVRLTGKAPGTPIPPMAVLGGGALLGGGLILVGLGLENPVSK